MENPILEGCRYVVKNASYVKIKENKIKDAAKEIYSPSISPPSWDFYPFPPREDEDKRKDEIYNFFLFLDANNFCFWRKKGSNLDKWSYSYKEKTSSGAGGLWLLCRKLYDEGKFNPNSLDFFLKLEEKNAKELFGEIPLIEERVKIWREVAENLKNYNCSFRSLIEQNNRDIEKILKILITEFPQAFWDVSSYKNKPIPFLKKALLLLGMIQGRFGIFDERDVKKEMTVYADYQLPRVLRYLGILEYSFSLAKKVDNLEIIPRDSEEEVEIRASTIIASKMIEKEIEKIGRINPVIMDYLIWKKSREEEFKKNAKPHHLTITTCY